MHDRAHDPNRLGQTHAAHDGAGPVRATDRAETLLLCRQRAGTCAFRTGGAIGRLMPGDVLLIDPIRGVAFTGDVAAMERLALSQNRVQASQSGFGAAHGRRFDGRSPVGAMLGALLDVARERRADLPGGLDEAGEAILRAVISAVATAAGEGVPGRRGEETLSCAIRGHIEARLADPALTPAVIASQFGLSRASLYRLWRPFGGVATHIRERRLLLARALLAEGRHHRITMAEIAHRCGFRDESGFSRAYRRRFGCAPSRGAGPRA